MSASDAATSRSRRKEARPHEILSAALSLFAHKGYAATKMEDIARAAGVSRGTPYLYFSNKEELFKAVLAELLLPRMRGFAQEASGWQGSAVDLLRHFYREWWALQGATELAALPRLMFAEAGNFPEAVDMYRREYIEPGQQLVHRIIDLGISRGEFRDVNRQHMHMLFASPMVMCMLMQQSLHCCLPEQFDPQRYLDEALDVLLFGLTKRQGEQA